MRTQLLLTMVVSTLFVMAFKVPSAQQSVAQQSTPQRTPQFENEDVAVWKTVVPPKLPLAMHTHQHPRVIIPLTSGTMRIAFEDGSFETHVFETGKAYWLSSAEGKKRHADVNISDKPIEVMVVELKKAE